MTTQLKKGVLDLCVLYAVSKNDTYGYAVYQEINNLLEISESTIYPVLRRLTAEGNFVTYLKESTEGPARKYFQITEIGLKNLEIKTNEFNSFNKIIGGYLN